VVDTTIRDPTAASPGRGAVDDGEAVRLLDGPVVDRSAPATRRPARPRLWPPSPGVTVALSLAFLAFAVLSFSSTWRAGELVLDGPGVAMYLEIALDKARSGGVPYWVVDMWAGAPVWNVVPSFPPFTLLPLAFLLGPETTIKLTTLGFQIAGAWGAFVLARSLWGSNTPAPVVAGLLYGLHPLVVSHGALFGHQPTLAVLAATPWLVWSFRLALRGDGAQYVALAAMLAAFAVLYQAEHAYGLAVLCALLLVVRLAQAREHGLGRLGADGVLVRAVAVAVIALGIVAYWLVPFLSLAKSFVLSPSELVRDFLVENPLSQEPGAFVRRAEALAEPVMFHRTEILEGPFYLSWVCLVLALVGVGILARRDHDRTLTTVLCASALNVWMSTGAIPLAASGPARRGQVIFFVAIGLGSGLLLGAFLRVFRLRPGTVLGIAAVVLLVTLPFLTPFVALQRIVPLLASIRFPRFYPVAILGLALAAAYPVTLVQDWARRRSPSLALGLASAVSIAVIGVFLVDAHPYRSYYGARRLDASTYDAVLPTLAAAGHTSRVATDRYAVPEDVTPLLDAGVQLSVGWPHPVAAKDLWPLTVKALTGPVGYRDRALGLSSTRYVVKQDFNERGEGPPMLREVTLEENGAVLPLVRAYEQAVVVADSGIAPIMATALAHKQIVTITGQPGLTEALEGVSARVVGSADACRDTAKHRLGAGTAGEVAMACGMRTWVNADAGAVDLGPGGSGAVFEAELDGLHGVNAWLDRLPGETELALHELGADGRSLGPEVVRVTASGVDENQIAAFPFEPIAGSAGRRYAFLLSCPRCAGDDDPHLLTARPPTRGSGNLIVDGQLEPSRNASFVLQYDRVPAAGEPSTRVVNSTRGRDGRVTVETSGRRPAVVVVADSWFPGWRAKVDGEPAPVLKADGAFLGVAVAPGDHTIELEYHKPVGALVGRAVTVVTVVITVIFLTAGRRRRALARLSMPNRSGDGLRRSTPRTAASSSMPGDGDGRMRTPRRWPVRRRRPARQQAPPTAGSPTSSAADPAGEAPPRPRSRRTSGDPHR
jgi:hypothetical protein